MKNNIISIIGTRMFRIIVVFIMDIIIVRNLGSAGYGKLAFVLMVSNFFAFYGDIGILDATQYFYKRSRYKMEYIYNINATALFVSSIIYYIGSLVALVFVGEFSSQNILLMSFGGVYVFATLNNKCIRNMMISDDKIRTLNKFSIVLLVLEISSVVALAVLNLLTVYSRFAITVIMIFLNYCLLMKHCSIQYRFRWNKTLLSNEIKYGVVSWMSNIFIYLIYQSDKLFVSKLCGLEILGIYALAVSLSNLLNIVSESFSIALTTKFYSLDEDSDERLQVLKYSIKLSSYFCLVITIIGLLLGNSIGFIFGTEFIASKEPFQLLLIATMFLSIGRIMTSYFYTNGNVKVIFRISFISLLINVIGNVILVKEIGAMGAALSSLIAYLIYSILYIFYFKKTKGVRLKEWFIVTKEDLNLLMNIAHSDKRGTKV